VFTAEKHKNWQKSVEAPGGIEPPHRSFADCSKTAMTKRDQPRRHWTLLKFNGQSTEDEPGGCHITT
jgi:hypothetical protein